MTQHFHLGANYVVSLLKGKWKISIICALGIKPMFYSELLKYEREINHTLIAKKVLTEQLNQLLDSKIITKTVYPTVPATVKYSLTPEGEKLSNLLLSLNQVGEELASKIGAIDFEISAHQAFLDHPKRD